MKMYKEQIELESHGGRPTYFDITPQLKKIIQDVSYTHLLRMRCIYPSLRI